MDLPIISIELLRLIEELGQEEDFITKKRKEEIVVLLSTIKQLKKDKDEASLIFICTHNSRRSQLSELWLRTAATYYGIKNIHTYSGGTESTAFNPRMVSALDRAGFQIIKLGAGKNPEYTIQVSAEASDKSLMFSKKYDDPYNPSSNFIAVMVCSGADKNCPVVQGALTRIALPYKDPKDYDNTPGESQAYDEKIRVIGREMLYLGRRL